LDGLQKHAGKKKPLIPRPWLLVGDYYIMIWLLHQKNERGCANQALHFITKLVVHVRKAKKRKRIVQFVAIFHLLKHGGPMTDVKHMRALFDFLKIHHTPRKYYTDFSG
jgi:hypothetical protein